MCNKTYMFSQSKLVEALAEALSDAAGGGGGGRKSGRHRTDIDDERLEGLKGDAKVRDTCVPCPLIPDGCR